MVIVAKPLKKMVSRDFFFTGRTDSVHAVDIRARVTGFLMNIGFNDRGPEVRGDDRLNGAVRVAGLLAAPWNFGPLLTGASLYPGRCEEGQLLFEIDPRPYRAQLEQAKSQVALNETSLRLARSTLARTIQSRDASSKQEVEEAQARVDEAEARVRASQASTLIHQLNLDYTRVTAPIDGKISRAFLKTGNLVNQDQTLLATIMALDPMNVFFDMEEPTLLFIRREINEGRIAPAQTGTIPVFMGLQDEQEKADPHPHEGRIDFINNQVNSTTGSILMRGVFPNPKSPTGTRLLSPGMFVRVRLPVGQPTEGVVIPERAIRTDLAEKTVWVVNDQHRVEVRNIERGPALPGGLRVITKGLNGDELVVLAGQQARVGDAVQMETRTLDPVSGEARNTPQPNWKSGTRNPK
jgi:multidrug efflux system membrane fusion protein